MIYLKLGEGASIFFDPTSNLLIRNNEVLAIEQKPRTKKFGLAFRSGHVTTATNEEYTKYLQEAGITPTKFVPTPTKKADKPVEVMDDYKYDPELLKMGPDELREMIVNEGFLDEDIQKFEGMTDVKEMIKLFDKINEEYK